jgi:hypothetical protein
VKVPSDVIQFSQFTAGVPVGNAQVMPVALFAKNDMEAESVCVYDCLVWLPV